MRHTCLPLGFSRGARGEAPGRRVAAVEGGRRTLTLRGPCDPRSMLAAQLQARLGKTIGEEDSVRYGVSVPNFGIGVDAQAIAELAREGWRGRSAPSITSPADD